MKMKQEERVGRRADRGEMSITNIIIAGIIIVAIFFGLRAFFGTLKEASTSVSESNKKVIESRKTLVTEQTERVKNTREAQEVP
jgi:uncharacterized membrane protein